MNNTTVDSLLPALAQAVPFLQGKSLIWALGILVGSTSACQALSNLGNVLIKYGPSDFVRLGCPGLVPIFQWLLAVSFTFQSTEWAWNYPQFALQLLLPGFCLINSKMIICNVTNMQSEMHSWTFMWFMLFPLNKYLGSVVPEWQVALVIYIVNMGTYVAFVICTIGQITEFLDIHCLTLKKKPEAKVADKKSK